ncbi:MAG: acetyl-CoA decarbonylase/synthase complex subunit delta [Oscillospiraceae bacterium]|nr:acetyl-CoA decarbonylase/synthase complex subunit delta [Oscillospiraceae bacterium]
MSFAPKAQAFNASINAVTIGTGEKAAVIGSINTMPFYTFDAPMANKQKIGVEILDTGMAEIAGVPGLAAFYDGCKDAVDMAKKASTLEGASFLALHFESADPNGADTSVEDCVKLAKAVADVTDLPLVVMGCKNVEKDAALFNAVSEALQGKNIVVLSAKEENYKTVGASAVMAYGQKVGAESAVDINLAKQMNVLLSQLGIADDSIIMNIGSAAAGYGYEYVVSTLDRVRAAALAQGDNQLQMPIITPISSETWGVKEAVMPESEMPAWGNQEERGVEMEIATAAACLASGSDAVILRHPASIAAIKAYIDALV